MAREIVAVISASGSMRKPRESSDQKGSAYHSPIPEMRDANTGIDYNHKIVEQISGSDQIV